MPRKRKKLFTGLTVQSVVRWEENECSFLAVVSLDYSFWSLVGCFDMTYFSSSLSLLPALPLSCRLDLILTLGASVFSLSETKPGLAAGSEAHISEDNMCSELAFLLLTSVIRIT
jgi:hypothetical protein